MIELLRRFCPSDNRKELSAPFAHNGFVYATDINVLEVSP